MLIRQNNTQLRQFSLTHFVLACHSVSDSVEQVGSHDLPKPLPSPPPLPLSVPIAYCTARPCQAQSHRIGLRLRLGHCLLEIFSLRLQLCPPPSLLFSSRLYYVYYFLVVCFFRQRREGGGREVRQGLSKRGCKNAEKARSSLLERQTEPWPWHFTTLSGTLLSFHFVSFRFSISL